MWPMIVTQVYVPNTKHGKTLSKWSPNDCVFEGLGVTDLSGQTPRGLLQGHLAATKTLCSAH